MSLKTRLWHQEQDGHTQQNHLQPRPTQRVSTSAGTQVEQRHLETRGLTTDDESTTQGPKRVTPGQKDDVHAHFTPSFVEEENVLRGRRQWSLRIEETQLWAEGSTH
jgi:hypothetical protein